MIPVFTYLFVLLILSPWINLDYSLIQGPEMRGEILLFSIIILPFLNQNRTDLFLKVALFFSAFYLLWSFHDASQGKLLFSDDHSVVLYRLQLLKQNFPFIPFYNPLWNAGLDARDFFATGILNLFLLFSPLIYLFPVESIYSTMISLVLFALAPALAWIGAKYFSTDKKIPWITALLTLTNSLFWYRWSLKYGSMGFVTSSLFVLITFALFAHLWDPLKKFTSGEAILFVLCATLMFFWSPTILVFLPCFVLALLTIKSLFQKSITKWIVLSLLCLNIPWVLLFVSVSKVDSFVSLSEQSVHPDSADMSKSKIKATNKNFSFSSIYKEIRDYAVPMNPLLFIFGIPGILLMEDRKKKFLFSTMSLWLLFLGLVIPPFKPQLEFDRMLIILGFILCYPAALFISHLFNLSFKNRWLIPGGAVVGGTLCTAVIGVGAILYNRSIEHYAHASSVYENLAETIKTNAGEGRTVFSGFVLHELDGGHVAPLMQKTNIPLVASSLYHNVWRYTNVIPKDFILKGDAGVTEFLDLMNASLVIAHEKRWRDFFFEKPESYSFISRIGVFNLFRRTNYTPNYFLEGSGSILSQNSNSVTVKMGSSEGVIKFNYFPFLYSDHCDLSPQQVSETLTFIKISNCSPGMNVLIRSKSGFSRLQS